MTHSRGRRYFDTLKRISTPNGDAYEKLPQLILDIDKTASLSYTYKGKTTSAIKTTFIVNEDGSVIM